jgi:hypothetical protein
MQIIRILLLFTLVALPAVSLAHGSGVSHEATDGAYFIDIGQEPTRLIDTDNAMFDFGLSHADTKEAAPFDHMWVRILKEGDIVLATGIRKQAFGPTTLLYSFPGAGGYSFEVSFRTKDGETMAKTSFSVDVTAAKNSFMSRTWQFLLAFSAVILAFGLYAILRAKRFDGSDTLAA